MVLGGCEALLGLDAGYHRGGSSSTGSNVSTGSGGGDAGGGTTTGGGTGSGSTTGGGAGSGNAGGGGRGSGGAGGTIGEAGGAAGSGGGSGQGGGCAYARVFATSELYAGDFAAGQPNAWAYAKAKCEERAAIAGLGSGWEPWLSVNGSNAAQALSGTGPWALVDCVTMVANDKIDLTDGAIAHPIDRNELNTPIGNNGKEVWTGTKADGSAEGKDCTGWTSTSASGRRGDSNSKNSYWADQSSGSCSASHRLYCFEAP
jgi:hypothetical protein